MGSSKKTGWIRLAGWAAVLFVIAAAVRVGWVGSRYGGERAAGLIFPDEEAYWLAGRSLAAGEGLVDEFGYRATYMPGYPWFVSLFAGLDRPLWWARMVQALLAAWVAPATFLLAWRWDRWSARASGVEFGGLGLAVLAGLAAAVDPFLVFFGGLILSEALFAAVLVTAWAVVVGIGERIAEPVGAEKPRLGGLIGATVVGGVLLWAAVMLRPAAAVLVGITVFGLAVGRRALVWRIEVAAIMAAVVVVGLLPWAARNRAVTGEWVWLTTRGGISLYDGCQLRATGASDLGHTKTMPEVQGLSEVEWDRCFKDLAWAEAKRDPGRMVWLAWKKLARTWSPRPNVEAYRQGAVATVSAAWMVSLMVLAAMGVWVRRRAAAAWGMVLVPVVVFTALHMVFVGSVRYRVPTMPMVMVLAATGLVWVVGRWRRTGSGGASDGAGG